MPSGFIGCLLSVRVDTRGDVPLSAVCVASVPPGMESCLADPLID
jgi:hypothetical protein